MVLIGRKRSGPAADLTNSSDNCSISSNNAHKVAARNRRQILNGPNAATHAQQYDQNAARSDWMENQLNQLNRIKLVQPN